MIGMLMGKKGMMKLLPIKIHSIKCPQDVTAPYPVHEKQLIIFLKNTGGIDIFTFAPITTDFTFLLFFTALAATEVTLYLKND